jgi:hypothetical protein
MRLLVSVTNKTEALIAVKGGAHIIDVKNPSEGSLGANFPWIIREIREAVPEGIEVSATIGDLPDLPGTASLAALGAVVSGANYVKVGLFGVREKSDAVYLMGKVCKAVKDCNGSSKVIAAGYADFEEIGCVNPLCLPEVAKLAGAHGVMVDVKMKDHGGLFDFLEDHELKKFVSESHRYGLIAALAGSLDKDDLPRAFNLGADIVGVRGAVCSKKDRLRGVVQRRAVEELVKVINSMNERQIVIRV